MHYVGFAELVAAVSNAGGLGIIAGLTQKTPELLAREISRCRELTDKPIGVNLTFLPVIESPDYPGYVKAIVEGGVRIVETAGNNPAKWMPMLKEHGITVIHKCTTVRHALKAELVAMPYLLTASNAAVIQVKTTLQHDPAAARRGRIESAVRRLRRDGRRTVTGCGPRDGGRWYEHGNAVYRDSRGPRSRQCKASDPRCDRA